MAVKEDCSLAVCKEAHQNNSYILQYTSTDLMLSNSLLMAFVQDNEIYQLQKSEAGKGTILWHISIKIKKIKCC